MGNDSSAKWMPHVTARPGVPCSEPGFKPTAPGQAVSCEPLRGSEAGESGQLSLNQNARPPSVSPAASCASSEGVNAFRALGALLTEIRPLAPWGWGWRGAGCPASHASSPRHLLGLLFPARPLLPFSLFFSLIPGSHLSRGRSDFPDSATLHNPLQMLLSGVSSQPSPRGGAQEYEF